MCDASGEELHMHVVPKMMSLEQTMSKNKMFFPIFYWLYTFGEKHIDVKKMNGRIKKKTNDKEKR
jgi:hypothetical protein